MDDFKERVVLGISAIVTALLFIGGAMLILGACARLLWGV